MNLTSADVLPDVRRSLPMFDHLPDDAPDVVDACARLAALYNVESLPPTHADAPHLDPRAFAGRRGGGVPDMSAVPDAWRGEHTVKRGRNRKGATAKVLARGDAPVVGRLDTDCGGRPLLAAPSLVADVLDWSWCAARLLVIAAGAPDMLDGRPNPDRLRRHRHGWSGIGVQRLTDLAASLDPEFPRALGTEAEAFATVVPGDRSSRSPVAAQRSDLSGMAHHPTLGRFVAPEGGYGAHTSKLDWSPRYRLTYRARKSDPGTPTTVRGVKIGRTITRDDMACFDRVEHVTQNGRHVTITGANDVPAWTPVRIVSLVSASADPERLHVGRRTVARVARQDRDKNGRTVNRGAVKARTVGTVNAPSTVDGWAELVAMLNRGERVIAHTASGNVTVTRGKGGKYSARDRRAGREQDVTPVRIPATIAARLAD